MGIAKFLRQGGAVGARLAREAFGVLEGAFAGKPRSYRAGFASFYKDQPTEIRSGEQIL
ncbi:hypothetical protein ACYZT2_07215 [Pseudomonas sp. MDT1-85]